MYQHLKKCSPVKQAFANGVPPQRRNTLAQAAMASVFAVSSIGVILPTTAHATIQGSVFMDWNDNATKDTWEMPLTTPITTITLRDNTKANSGQGGFYSTETDANGNYSFPVHDTGSFTIWSSMSQGWWQTTPIRGEGIGFYDFNVVNQSDTVTIDFGLLDPNKPANNLPVIAAGDNNVKITLGDSFTFVRNFTDADADDRHFVEWDFGDGNKASNLLPAKTYSSSTAYTYTQRGTFTATFKVTDARGDTVSTTITVTVEAPPIVNVGNDIALDVGELANFSGTFSDPDGRPRYNYTWKFGDGNTSTGRTRSTTRPLNVDHTFTAPGEYTLILEVTDKNGNTGSDTLIVNIRGINTDPCATGVAKVRSKAAWGMWDNPSTWNTGTVPGKTDWVMIQGGHSVILPSSISSLTNQVQVKGLCVAQNGVLQSAIGGLNLPPSWINMNAASIRNMGKIQSASGINGALLGNSYRHATAGGNIKFFVYKFVNDGEVLANGRGGDDMPYLYFSHWTRMDAQAGGGGWIEIYPAIFINNGRIQGGDGGAADAFRDWGRLVDGDARGGNGGLVRVFATNLAMSTNGATGQLRGGCGNYAESVGLWATTTVWRRWWRWRSSTASGTRRFVQGGRGGNVSVNLGNMSGITRGCNGSTSNQTLRRTIRRTRWIRRDPTVLTVDSTTRFEEAENIVLFGGEDWIMDLRNLSEGAITAYDTITLAVGKGGVIDLRGVNSKVFKAGTKLEIFADEILLDNDVTPEKLTDAPEVVVSSSKILYNVEWSHVEHIVDEPGVTLPIKLSLLNGGPVEDIYTISMTDSAGWDMGDLPSIVTVNSMRRSELVFDVTLPTTHGEENVITITAISQGDSNVQAVAEIRVGVIEEEVITPRTDDDENADLILIIDDTSTMASVLIMVSNALESFLEQFGVESSPTGEEIEAFLSQFYDDNLPTDEQMEAFLAQFKQRNQSLHAPIIELITFKDDDEIISRVVTKNVGEIIGRIRSIEPSGGGDCPNASVAALELALKNINPDGQIILATASSPHKATATAIANAQQQGIKVHVLLAGVCKDEAAEKALYQDIADGTSGTFSWLPRGETPSAEIEEVISTAVNESLAEVVEMVKERDAKLAVRLDDFTATAENGFITLKWTTGAEINSAGFHLWRAEVDQFGAYINLTKITISNLIPAQGESYNSIDYSHRDEAVGPNTTYYYALEEVDNNGQNAYHLDRIVSATTE